MCPDSIAIKQDIKEPEINNVIKALIIDDSTLDQMILKKMLVNSDYDVCLASDGKMAIDMFGKYQPDIIFMDLNLPDISGYELTKTIKKLSSERYVPVIFVTGTNDDESLGKCLDSGGDDFIVKPIKVNLLKAKTDSLLRVKKMHDELLAEKIIISSHNDEQIKDLHDANKVIRNLQKPRFYDTGNLEWSYVAQNILSGDIIFSAIDPSGKHILLIGDNTGHGLPAAIGSIITCETFYSMVNKGYELQAIVKEINKKLFYLLPTDRFLAACLLEIDSEYRIMNVWNAGLPSVLICDSTGEIKKELPSIYLPLGIILIDEIDIVPIRIKIDEGDRIYAYTDGLTEVFNVAGEMYGEQHLLASIKSNSNLDKRVDAIVNDTNEYSVNVAVTDDVLLLEINCEKKSRIEKQGKKEINAVEILPMDWNIKFELHTDVIKKSNPIPVVIQTMVNIQGFGVHRENIFLILTEMYSNAVEHGILNLDSNIKNEDNGLHEYYEQRHSRLNELTEGKIMINVEHYVEGQNGVISVTMENTGKGFDYSNIRDDIKSNIMKCGYGITLINDLCRKCDYSEGGRKLNVEYEWALNNIKNAV